MIRLYRVAPPDLRRWADQQLPDLREVAELTEERRVVHEVSGGFGSGLCTCGIKGRGIADGCPIHDRAF
jgi:hypothetical protein